MMLVALALAFVLPVWGRHESRGLTKRRERRREAPMTKKPVDAARVILLQLAERTTALRAWKKKHSDVYEKGSKIEKDVAGFTDELKKAVREMAVPGETVKVFDDEVGKVLVVAGQASPGYNLAVAVESLWELDEDLAEKAELPREDLTPRVTIEIR